MNKIVRRRGRAWKPVFAGLGLLVLGLVFALSPGGVPEVSSFQPSLADIRAFAGQGGGALPTALRSLQVGTGSVPRLFVVSGASVRSTTLVHYTYQVVYQDRTLIIDAVHDQTMTKEGFPGQQIFPEPYARMQDALRRADRIAVTHEHFDHCAGIARSPYFDEIAPRVVMTEEQLNSPDVVRAGFTQPQLSRLEPLRYERMHLLSPGIVLVKAPGHTPGSQMVYVRLQDGKEFLLVGDIAWNGSNISLPRMHPRLLNWIIGEDPEAMGQQLRYLHALTEAEPSLHIVVAHDDEQMADYVKRGLVQDGLL